jgi:hypothetical protein
MVCEERLLDDGGEGYIGCYEEGMIKSEGKWLFEWPLFWECLFCCQNLSFEVFLILTD